jgi:hypothetical protein
VDCGSRGTWGALSGYVAGKEWVLQHDRFEIEHTTLQVDHEGGSCSPSADKARAEPTV